MDPNTSCGVVSLSVVCHWLGKPQTIERLNALTHSDETGTSSLQDLKDAARSLGFAAETVRLGASQPVPWTLPTIVHLRENHFAATLPVDAAHLVVVDPPKVPEVVDRSRLTGDWSGATLVAAATQTELDQALKQAGILKK